MKDNKIKGLIAATFSPFDQSGDLNLDIIPAYYSHLVDQMVDGAFICGTTGEGSALTFEEKRDTITAWSRHHSDNFKVMAMVSGTCQKEAVALAGIASKLKIHGIAINAPYYFKPGSVTQLVDYLAPIAESAPELAVYFYHIPLLTGVQLSMLELLDLAGKRIPNFVGIKYTHNDLMEFNRCLRFQGGRYDLLWGWDETYLAGRVMGAQGAVGSTYNFAASIYQNIDKYLREGNHLKALEWQQKSIDFISLYGRFGGGAAGKAILKLCGIDCGDFRPPMTSLSDQEFSQLRNALEDLNFFEDISQSIIS